jgi:hypothetical protein
MAGVWGLRGNLDGLHSIRVNKRWRPIFQRDSRRGEAKKVYLERFRAKWIPVRVKKTRQNKRLELGSDSIRTDKAPDDHSYG